jgi:hypothetical protein
MLKLQGVAEKVLAVEPDDAGGDVSGGEPTPRLRRGMDMRWCTWSFLATAGGAGSLMCTWANAGAEVYSLRTGRTTPGRQASENTSLPS